MRADSTLKLFSGSSNPELAAKIAEHLGVELGQIKIRRFKDGEIWVKYTENIRGADVFLIQPTNAPADNILELLIMMDAARRASARRITAVIPYYGYARQDRKDQPRVAITAKLLANLIVQAGADRVLTMDLHAAQIQGFFDIPFDHLYGSFVFSDYFRQKAIPNLVVSAPDVGGIRMARSYASRLNAELALCNKRREEANEVKEVEVIGDVRNKNVLLVDDIVDTANTLIKAAAAMKKEGATDVYAACSHALLSGDAVEKIRNSPIKELVVTDSLRIPAEKRCEKMRILSVASMFAQAIDRIHNEKSISILFDVEK